ncbi:hypothetical protein HMPREF0059_00929 [Actinomyces viscosus C505]|uniref:CobQ/CobB/MinD/ParA nucleotide binding domain-containing protein n=1 Tax=Actinomyces viscosus C505 TaxID=562973 RepID=F2UXX6_ACTVI|nr:hypothetical protein HMPREF0059_00929 [Actinomyces viscosus C505]
MGRGGRGATGAFLRPVSTGPTTSLGAVADGPAPWWRAAGGGAAVPPYHSCGVPAGEPGDGCGNGRGNGRPWAGPGRQSGSRKERAMPVEMPVRQTPVPAGDGAWQPGQLQLPGTSAQSEETLTIPAVAASGGAAAPELEEKDPTSEATEGARARQAARGRPAMGRRPVWDGRDVSFPPLRPSAGEPAQSGAETQPGERRRSLGAARSGRPAQVLAVTGARGGLGASVLLLHLAWALGRAGRRVAMMDLDPTGGLDLLCGQSVLTGLRWADLPAEESAFRPGHLVGALPVWHAMPVLTGDVRGGPLPCAEAVLEAMRAEHDVVLVDLPRGAPRPWAPGSSS